VPRAHETARVAHPCTRLASSPAGRGQALRGGVQGALLDPDGARIWANAPCGAASNFHYYLCCAARSVCSAVRSRAFLAHARVINHAAFTQNGGGGTAAHVIHGRLEGCHDGDLGGKQAGASEGPCRRWWWEERASRGARCIPLRLALNPWKGFGSCGQARPAQRIQTGHACFPHF
jgi:hypothetical protein